MGSNPGKPSNNEPSKPPVNQSEIQMKPSIIPQSNLQNNLQSEEPVHHTLEKSPETIQQLAPVSAHNNEGDHIVLVSKVQISDPFAQSIQEYVPVQTQVIEEKKSFSINNDVISDLMSSQVHEIDRHKQFSSHQIDPIFEKNESNIKNRDGVSEFAYYFKLGSGLFHYYNHIKGKFLRTKIKKSTELFEYDSCHSPKGVFLAGGYRYSKERPVKQTYEYDHEKLIIVDKAGLNVPRAGTALACINYTSFYCVGGYYKDKSDNVMLQTSEKYDYYSNKWVEIPSISQPKSFASLCVLKNDVYCIGGRNWNSFTHDYDYFMRVEKLQSDSECSGWEIIKFENSIGSEGRIGSGLISIDSNQILLFGGETKGKHDECYIIDLSKNNILQFNRMNEPDGFEMWKPMRNKKHIFVFSAYFNFYACTIEKQKWRMVPKEKVKWEDI